MLPMLFVRMCRPLSRLKFLPINRRNEGRLLVIRKIPTQKVFIATKVAYTKNQCDIVER